MCYACVRACVYTDKGVSKESLKKPTKQKTRIEFRRLHYLRSDGSRNISIIVSKLLQLDITNKYFLL